MHLGRGITSPRCTVGRVNPSNSAVYQSKGRVDGSLDEPMSCIEISNMKNIIFSSKFTLTPLGVTLVNLRGREHKLLRDFLAYV